MAHPRESILLLRGRVKKSFIYIYEVIIPPSSIHGVGFSNFPIYRLPTDLSIVGIAHSHPSGGLRPSLVDLNNFFGRLMMIVAYPYLSKEDISVYDRKGRSLKFEVVEKRES